MTADAIYAATEAILSADALLVAAGAGMGVDSGLPDFRSSGGFWNAYPCYEDLRLSFTDLGRPSLFVDAPRKAWGFYGHRLGLYRKHAPHHGYYLLLDWFNDRDGFVYTSNVDGHFSRCGFSEERVLECHGSLNFLQCRGECVDHVFAADDVDVIVDEATMEAVGDLPRCNRCGAGTRPNVLMFYDSSWSSVRSDIQEKRYEGWCQRVKGNSVAIVEIGCGTAIPTVREECEAAASEFSRCTHIRINPSESFVRGGVSIALPALVAIGEIDSLMKTM